MTKITIKKFKKACIGSGGIQAVVARAMGVTRQSLSVYLKKNSDLRDFLENEGEQVMDVAEHNIDREIMIGDVETSKWALLNRKRGKARGYGPKQEFDASNETRRIIIERASNGKT